MIFFKVLVSSRAFPSLRFSAQILKLNIRFVRLVFVFRSFGVVSSQVLTPANTLSLKSGKNARLLCNQTLIECVHTRLC